MTEAVHANVAASTFAWNVGIDDSEWLQTDDTSAKHADIFFFAFFTSILMELEVYKCWALNSVDSDYS